MLNPVTTYVMVYEILTDIHVYLLRSNDTLNILKQNTTV